MTTALPRLLPATPTAVFENLSRTERRHLKFKFKTEKIKIKHQPDRSYYNTGSFVHPLSITGIEITFNSGLQLRLVEWGNQWSQCAGLDIIFATISSGTTARVG